MVRRIKSTKTIGKRVRPDANTFKLEEHLLAVLHSNLGRQLLRGKQIVANVRKKMQVGMIVPDLVVVIGHSGKRRRRYTSPSLSLFDCGLLAEVLKHGPVTENQISSAIFARHSTVQLAIQKLARLRLVVQRRDKTIVARQSLRALKDRIISVEAKLIRWRDALQQAKSYQRFSNASYVALPRKIVERRPQIRTACKSDGVGLISVNGHRCDIVLLARLGRLMSAEWLWIANKLTGLK